MAKKITLFGFFCLTTFFALLQSGCKKIPDATVQPEPIVKAANEIPDSFFVKNRKVPGVAAGQENSQNFRNNFAGGGGNTEPSFEDFETPTILGNRLVNPYSIQNMTTAFQLMGSSLTPNVTDLYVRFKPANFAELDALDDSLDLELQDYPMDYEVLQYGDYYIEPAQTDQEEIPWLYTVVPANYQFPQGIQHQVIEQLHIPEDNLFLEELAESLVAGATYLGGMAGGHRTITRTNLAQPLTVTNQCPCLEPGPEGCAVEWCNPGFPPPPGTNTDPNRPRGRITVFDTHIAAGGSVVPVKKVRVVTKRWFKIARTYTNDNGEFSSTRLFNNRFRVNVRFRNDMASVRSLRGARVWQMLFPVFHSVGVFNRGAQVNHTFNRDNSVQTAWHWDWMRKWMAATVHNQLQEHKALAQAEGVGTFSSSNRLNVLLTNHSLGIKSGAEFRAPMHKQKRKDFGHQDMLTLTKLASYAIKGKAGLLLAIYNAIKLAVQTQQPDITITYRTDIRNLSSNEVARNVYGAMTYAAIYKASGVAIYDKVTKAIFKFVDLGMSVYGMAKTKWKDSTYFMHDLITSIGLANSIIQGYSTFPIEQKKYALYHGYAIFMGNLLASKKYSINSDMVQNQRRADIGNSGNLTSHTRFLEEYNPNEQVDAYRWIPVGLFYDLIDEIENTPVVPNVIDQVDYFNNSELWFALVGSTTEIDINQFRLRLNWMKPQGTHTTNQLFHSYNY